MVYDVTSADSLAKVRDWIKELNKMLGMKNVQLAIIGNKVDLLNVANEQRAAQVSSIIREAMQLADELQNARHYLTSAKLNQGIGELFVSLSRRMIEQHKRLAATRRDSKTAAGSRFMRTISLAPDETRDEQTAGARLSQADKNKLTGTGPANSCSC